MTTLENATIGNGNVTYISKVDPRPETRTSETNENVTVNVINAAVPSTPAHYDVSFMLMAGFATDGLAFSNIFHWKCIISEPDDNAPYRSIEDRAARQIAPMLRALADRIEADLPDFDHTVKGEPLDKAP